MSQKAFTLVELVVVMAIVGVLGTVGVFSYRASLENANATKSVTIINDVKRAVEFYRVQTGFDPPSCGIYCTSATDPLLVNVSGVVGWGGPYIKDGIYNMTHPWKGHVGIDTSDRDGDGVVDVAIYLDDDLPGTNYGNNQGVIPNTALQRLDEILDDGNLSAGNAGANGYLTSAQGEFIMLVKQ